MLKLYEKMRDKKCNGLFECNTEIFEKYSLNGVLRKKFVPKK